MLLPETNSLGALAVAENIRRSLAKVDLALEGEPVERVTVSIGVASVVPDGASPFSALFQAADEALYQAKRSGRDRVEVARKLVASTTSA